MQQADRVRDSFTLRKELSARVERLARRRGMSRSAIYRAAIEAYLATHEEAAITAAIDAAVAGQAQDLDFVRGARTAVVDAGLVGEWDE